MENSLESYKEEENMLTKYIKQIDELTTGNKKEELEKGLLIIEDAIKKVINGGS